MLFSHIIPDCYSRYNSPEERDLINSYSWGIPLQGIFPQSTASRRETRDSSLVEDIRNTASSVTVRIEMTSEGTNGSGVIIARRKNNYYVLTNEHVVRQTQERTRLLAVIAPDGKRYEVQDKTVKTLSNMDLAVLQFRSSNDYEVATLGQNNLTETGGYVFLSGFPGNKDELDFTVGNLFQEKDKAVKAKDQLSFSYGYGLVYSNDSAPGMSGGPIFDVRGHVVGIHGRAEGENIVLQKGGSDRGKINIGYSLGVPIKSFLGLVDGVEMESGWLTVDETQLSKLSFIEEKEIDSALPELTPPVEKANPIAWLKYGNKLWRRSKYEEALAAFNEAIKLDRSLYLAWYGKGQTFLDRREYGEALEALLKAIEESEGQFALAWGKQGEALYRLAYAATDISKEKYEEALELALESINIALALDKEHISFYFSQGFILYELKRYQETIVAYNEVIAINGDAIAYNNRGIAHDKLGNYQFGIEDYNQAIALAPKYANAYYNRGNTHHELGKYEEAIEDYNQAIALNPQLVEAYNNRGATHDKLGNYQFAIEDYNQAIALDPQDASAYNNRGNTHHDLGKYQFAIEDYNQAIALNPQDASAYNNRGNTHHDLGKYQFAIEDYNQAIALNPQDASAYNNRGGTHDELGNYQFAIQDYNQAIALNPQFALAYMGRSLNHSRLGNYQKAMEDYNKAIKINPALEERFKDY